MKKYKIENGYPCLYAVDLYDFVGKNGGKMTFWEARKIVRDAALNSDKNLVPACDCSDCILKKRFLKIAPIAQVEADS